MTLAPDAQPITLPSGIRLYETRAEAPPNVSLDDFEAAIGMLEFIGRAHQWHLGDLLIAGEAVYGDDLFNRVSERTGLDMDSLDNMRRVARRFAHPRRRGSIAWSVYEALASLDDDGDQDALLDEGEDQGWKLVQFRARVRNLKSGFKADRNGFTDAPPSADEQHALAKGDRVDCCTLEASVWPADSIDLIVLSPPYGLSKAYLDGGDVDGWDAYQDAVAAWSQALVKLLHPHHGRLALNVPLDRSDSGGKVRRTSYVGRPIYATWVNALCDAGLGYRSSIVWWDNDAGEGTTRGSVDSPSAPHIVAPCEMIALMYRGGWSRSSERQHDLSHADWLELGPRGVWQLTGTSDHSEHPAPWPLDIPERLVKLLSFRGDIVADPMCGRGTLGMVAGRLGRRVWLADRSAEYTAIARQHLLEARGLSGEHAAAA